MCASAACQDDRKFWSASCTKWRPPREQRGQFTHSARGRAACGHFGVGENASGHRLRALHAPAACLQLACIWIRSTRGQDREYLAGFGLHPAYSRFRQTAPRVSCKPAHSTHSHVFSSSPLLTCPCSALSAIAGSFFFSRDDR